MKARILQIMENEGMSPSKFAETIGIQRSAMSHILSERNNPSLDVLVKILETFPYVDSDWLLFGKGEMRRISTSVSKQQEPNLFSDTPFIRTIPQPAAEYRKENGVKEDVNTIKSAEKEVVIRTELVSKKINKLVIFYADDTYETFVPEKNKKE
ncbi:MAG: helix-turn-helix transcriptional regulator [Massilibacteroides sp.]|nr:helix-turn-helix transcriptional regulator [Massilibacteroides sp.]MDD3061388.1 helix-turn-helix transcriptional regulator [Massilibacteroides sp.]MDD4115140.1 helix-turn-helix transcriptional regulator [Massilibacteroides sp.]MDD4659479.1 helix-turn-helix transcriptional regulator [Massilibacteroides sp.]